MSRDKVNFISYTSANERWAEWIGWILEEQGFSVRLQAWDFAAGSNFVLEMQPGSLWNMRLAWRRSGGRIGR
jgi:hypothetical protein